MEKNEDDDFGSHIVISTADVRRFWKFVAAGCFSIIIGLVGFIVERYYTRDNYTLMVQGQKDVRQSIQALSKRVDDCERSCGAYQSELEAHLENGRHEARRGRWSRAGGE